MKKSNTNKKEYQYYPLSLFTHSGFIFEIKCSLDEFNVKDANWELRVHVGKPNEDYKKDTDESLPFDSLIDQGRQR